MPTIFESSQITSYRCTTPAPGKNRFHVSSAGRSRTTSPDPATRVTAWRQIEQDIRPLSYNSRDKPMLHRFVHHNGQVLPIEQVRLSPGQAGLLSGWGLFTTLRVF